MAVETKPIFSPELVRQRAQFFTLPVGTENARARLTHWADLIASGKADKLTEKQLLPDFISDIFCAFFEDRRLHPAETVRAAFEHIDPYNPPPVWKNFCGLSARWMRGARA